MQAQKCERYIVQWYVWRKTVFANVALTFCQFTRELRLTKVKFLKLTSKNTSLLILLLILNPKQTQPSVATTNNTISWLEFSAALKREKGKKYFQNQRVYQKRTAIYKENWYWYTRTGPDPAWSRTPNSVVTIQQGWPGNSKQICLCSLHDNQKEFVIYSRANCTAQTSRGCCPLHTVHRLTGQWSSETSEITRPRCSVRCKTVSSP